MAYLVPPGPPWRITAVSRWPSNTPQGDLTDVYSRRITFDLLKPGTLSLVISGKSPQIAWLSALTSDLVAYRWNGITGAYQPMYRGVINHSEDEISAAGTHTVTLNSTDYRGVLARRTLRDGVTWTNIEQSSIVQSLVQLGDQPRGYSSRLGLNYRCVNPDGSPLAATGVLRQRTYLFGQIVSSAIDDISTDISGFNWSVEPDLNDSSATAVATLWYPYRGVSQPAWVAHYGSTVSDLTRTVDSTTFANYYATIGYQATIVAESFGDGWNNPQVFQEGAWMTVTSDNTVSVQTTLQQNTDGYIALYGDAEPGYTLTLVPGRWSPSDAWLGDVVRLIVNEGHLHIDTDVRITAVDVSIDEQGREAVTLTAGILPMGAGELVRSIDRRLATLEAR